MKDALSKICSFLFPYAKIGIARDPEGTEKDVNHIKAANFKFAENLALEEARKFESYQEDRTRTSESKATLVLGFEGVLLPVLIAQSGAVQDLLLDALPSLVLFAISLLGGIYFVLSVVWAFRTFKVSLYHTIDVIDLVNKWERFSSEEEVRKNLIQHVMANARKNYDVTNDKVTCILLSYRYLYRAFVVFLSGVVLNLVWNPLLGFADVVGCFLFS